MTKYEYVKSIINDKEKFIGWAACMMASVAVGEEDFNRFALARDTYKNWLREKWADREIKVHKDESGQSN